MDGRHIPWTNLVSASCDVCEDLPMIFSLGLIVEDLCIKHFSLSFLSRKYFSRLISVHIRIHLILELCYMSHQALKSCHVFLFICFGEALLKGIHVHNFILK